MKCSICREEAVYDSKYSGTQLCGKHLMESIEKRVRAEIRKQMHLGTGKTRIAVALSGGKDSSVTLFILNRILAERKNTELVAVTVDEGIAGYRNDGIESASELCRTLGIEHHVLSFKEEYSTTLDSIVEKDPETIPCSHCGPMRRTVMNKLALNVKADYIALGMNLDDYSQSILMNVVRGDYDRMLRMAPHEDEKEGLVRRVLPLIRVPEKEVLLYAILAGIRYDSKWCPYFEKAQRNTFRQAVEKFEEEFPGSRFAILRFAEKLRNASDQLMNGESVGKCRICGNPSSSDVCPVCSRLGDVNS